MQITALVIGGSPTTLTSARTVADVKSELKCAGYTAKVNQRTELDSYELQDGDFVSLAEQVKGN